MTQSWAVIALIAVLVFGLIAYVAYRARRDQKRYVPPPEYTAPDLDPLYYSVKGGYAPLSRVTYTPAPVIIMEQAPVIIFEPVGAIETEPTRFEYSNCNNSVADATGTTDTWGDCSNDAPAVDSSSGDTQ